MSERNFYFLVCGSRDYADYESVLEVLSFVKAFYGERARVIHGLARGADMLAQRACDELGIPAKGVAADWNGRGKSAGPERNRHMADLLVKWRDDHGHWVQCLAFPGGSGTRGMVSECLQRGIPVDWMTPPEIVDVELVGVS